MATSIMQAPTKISQLSCFSSIHRNYRPSLLRLKVQPFVVMSLDGNEGRSSLNYAAEVSKPLTQEAIEAHPRVEDHTTSRAMEAGVNQPKTGAKIHDFCFGIPYGGLVLSGGLISFVFSRNPMALSTGVLCGGALLALSTFSLKIWKQGKSSLPFILGQAVLSAFLLWKNFQAYSLTKKLFPTGLYAAISAAMLCFYSYVVLSGGNPPPKKSKPYASS